MKKGFTLIELLVVVGIIAILAIVVLLVVNPAELLKQGRDATRVSDMGTLNKAISLYYQDGRDNPNMLFMGTSSVIYVSIPDPAATSTAGDQCQGLGLPTAPSGTVYQCAATSNYMKVDGTGWIPINFNSYSAGSVISQLPDDPTNTTSTGLYYTYATDGNAGFKVTAFLESQKDGPQMAKDSGTDSLLYEKGSNLALAAGRGLIAYWPLSEGSGAIAYDLSGAGDNATISSSSYWSATGCKTGGSCLSLPGVSNNHYAYTPASPLFDLNTSNFTVMLWVNPSTALNLLANGVINGGTTCSTGGIGGWMLSTSQLIWCTPSQIGISSYGMSTGYAGVATGTWNHVAFSFNLTGNILIYVNGVLKKTVSSGGLGYVNSATPISIGCQYGGYNCSMGLFNDVRIYNYELPAAQIQAIYNAEKNLPQ
jgi:prepilin-type N-terminal cleavage/methylation domain-containing protein